MATSFRDRFFTPPVAKATTSASGILAAGVGGALGMLTGFLPLAFVGAVIGWAGRVAFAIPREPAADRIDAFTLDEPWRQLTRDALGNEMEFREAIKKTRSSAMKERLSGLDDQIDDAVQEAWRIARAGNTLADAYARINVSQDQKALAELTQNRSMSELDKQTAASLEAQIQTAVRLQETIISTRDRLRLLNAKMGELVARTIELSVSADSPDSLAGVATDISAVTDELEALRQAVDITNQAERYGTASIDMKAFDTPTPAPDTRNDEGGQARRGGAV